MSDNEDVKNCRDAIRYFELYGDRVWAAAIRSVLARLEAKEAECVRLRTTLSAF